MIKPPLYLFDPDQTHDLLWAEKIDGNIAALLSNAFQNHGLFDSGLPVVLVDRYIPGGDHLPWASEWSTVYFEFLKELSRTHLLTNGEINGSDYGFEPEYQANLPEVLNLGSTFPDKVKVKFAKGTTGSVTWLERAHSETASGQYCPQVSNKIQVWSRRSRVVTAPNDKDVVIELDCRLWLHNSAVLQSASFEGLSDAQKKLLDYAELDDVLEKCWSQFSISDCVVLTSFTYSLENTYQDLYRFRSTGIGFSEPGFTAVPKTFHHAYLFSDDKEFGNITILYSELTKQFTVSLTYFYSYLDAVEDLPCSAIPECAPVATVGYNLPTFPATVQLFMQGLGGYSASHLFLLSRGGTMLEPEDKVYPEGTGWVKGLGDEMRASSGVAYSYFYGANPIFGFSNSNSGLFYQWETGFCNARLHLGSDGVTGGVVITRKHKGAIQITLSDPPEDPFSTEVSQAFFATATYETYSGDSRDHTPTIGNSVSISRYVTQVRNPPSLVLIAEETILYRGIEADNLLKQLIEPEPGRFTCDPNPDPLQNRNTDPLPNDQNNTEWIGDIMPDSIRIKEIHAALQADKYAIDDKDTTKARVTNLGWLIDKMSNVLGLHFASDGKMLKVRNTEHKKDGDTIPEQWQIGQWGKNNWIAEDGTAVNGVGYAYEVRSNGFATNKFTGEATAIEEGGWVLCNSLIQLLEVKYDDDDRAFGLQDMGANVIPKSDRLGYLKYEGMHGLLVEIAYMLSSMSGNITRSEVLDMKSVAMLQELIAAQGLPVTLKTMPAKVGGIDVNIPYPGFEENAPSLVDFMFWILANLSPLVGGTLALKPTETEEKNV